MTKPIKAWWFAPADRKLANGDGRLIRRNTTHVHRGDLVLCQSGLHASRRITDALKWAPGPILCRVECGGEVVEGADKLVCTRRKYLAVVDATAVLLKFARLCALDVIDNWDAPGVVIRYLRTGDEQLRAAAMDAAWAARDAAMDARAVAMDARAAAWAARAVAMDARAAAWAARDAMDAMDARGAQEARLRRLAGRLMQKGR